MNYENRTIEWLEKFNRVSELINVIADLIKIQLNLPFELKNYTGSILNDLWNKPELTLELDKKVSDIWNKK